MSDSTITSGAARKNYADAELNRIVQTGDALTPYIRDLVGSSVQLRFPMRDPIDFRRQADVLQSLVQRLRELSHSKQPADSVMLRARELVKATQAALTSKPRGYRKNSAG